MAGLKRRPPKSGLREVKSVFVTAALALVAAWVGIAGGYAVEDILTPSWGSRESRGLFPTARTAQRPGTCVHSG